mmetsp:Transcript_30756/g.106317  ORF Transcript_30756/g.106317 Transcript_30756/m.106317 type:complete len:204 (+) Transcript_30756:178-789(+)
MLAPGAQTVWAVCRQQKPSTHFVGVAVTASPGDGSVVGTGDGSAVGTGVGASVGTGVGASVGASVGISVGSGVGLQVPAHQTEPVHAALFLHLYSVEHLSAGPAALSQYLQTSTPGAHDVSLLYRQQKLSVHDVGRGVGAGVSMLPGWRVGRGVVGGPSPPHHVEVQSFTQWSRDSVHHEPGTATSSHAAHLAASSHSDAALQ